MTQPSGKSAPESTLFVSFIYPSSDPITLAYDDNGIANNLPPNRTIGGDIVPGPFYVIGTTPDGGMCDIDERLFHKYMFIFWEPEIFGPGEWEVVTEDYYQDDMYVISQKARWRAKATPSAPLSSAPVVTSSGEYEAASSDEETSDDCDEKASDEEMAGDGDAP